VHRDYSRRLIGDRGSFKVAKTDKKGKDLRAKGRLQYVGKHHLQFAGTKEYFLKAGADAPEIFMAYEDFDGTYTVKNPPKTWQPHVQDWKAGGAGVEYYFGYQLPQNDLICEDWRSREKSWDYARIALEFFRDNKIPFWDMKNANALIGNAENNNSKYCLARAGEVYLVLLPTPARTGCWWLENR